MYHNPEDPDERLRDLESWRIIFPGMFAIFGIILSNILSSGDDSTTIIAISAACGAAGFGIYSLTENSPYKSKTKIAVSSLIILILALIVIKSLS